MAFGSTVTLQDGAQVKGDLTVMGKTILLNGSVTGDVFARGEQVTLGAVGGSADVAATRTVLSGRIGNNVVSKGNLQPGSEASVLGNLRYWSPSGELSDTAFVKGKTTFDATLMVLDADDDNDALKGGVFMAALAGAIGIFSVLSAALCLLVLMPLLPKLPTEAAKYLTQNPWQSIGAALGFFFGLPMIAVILAITVFGIPLALIVIMKFICGLLLSRILASLVLVRWLEHRKKASWNAWLVGALAVTTFIGLHLLNIVPVLGWLVSTALVLMGFGALILVSYEKVKKIL
jgi:magnesium-transporting ATPase (P-type)